MKKIFFTSNTKHYHKEENGKASNELDNTNGIVDQLNDLLFKKNTIVFVASSPNNYEKTDNHAKLLFEGLKLSGISFDNYLILDNRTSALAADYISNADLVFLSGGDTYVQNEFFHKINLGELLNIFDGIIVGQSAGSINLAKDVYNSPDINHQSDPVYMRGLGLSDLNIEPHFDFDEEVLSSFYLKQRKHILNESYKRDIYALTDGAHIYEDDDKIVAYGESYLIKDGTITLLCNSRESHIIKEKQALPKK